MNDWDDCPVSAAPIVVTNGLDSPVFRAVGEPTSIFTSGVDLGGA